MPSRERYNPGLFDWFAERVRPGLAVLDELDEQHDPAHDRNQDEEIIGALAPDVVESTP